MEQSSTNSTPDSKKSEIIPGYRPKTFTFGSKITEFGQKLLDALKGKK
jgi:hypothetical protein